MNLMSVDIERQLNLFWACAETASNVLGVIVSLMLLYYKLGSVMLSGFSVLVGVLLFYTLNIFLFVVKIVILFFYYN